MTNNIIPIFYHIPKNAGTYVFHSLLTQAKTYNKTNVHVIRVLLQEKYTITKFIVLNNSNFFNRFDIFTPFKNSKMVWTLNVDNLTTDILQKLSLHSIFIESRGFRCTETSLKPLFIFLSKFNLYKFIILREPFSREQSLYHYLTSDKSKHEHTHGKFKSSSFEEHITSKQLNDSWLIRVLLNLSSNEQISEDHFNKACEVLKTFNVYESKNTEKVIKDVLLNCFNIRDFDMNTSVKKHENAYKKIKFEDLSIEHQEMFKKRKYWDQKIYDYFINKRL